MFVALALPNMAMFGVLSLFRHDFTLAALVAASAALLVAGWRMLKSGRDARTVYRLHGFVFGLLVLYMVGVGGDAGSKSLWIYTYPLIMIFLLGEREGAIWALGLLGCALATTLLSPPTLSVYVYAADFLLRLSLSYVIVVVATVGFEYARRRYRDRLLAEQEKLWNEKRLLDEEVVRRILAEQEKERLIRELQDTLAQVKTLKGLVPICSNCHRIRDDQGFWTRLESYLRDHSDAEFSHGMCPECSANYYPDDVEGAG
jgi:signal transduction histidine kinase